MFTGELSWERYGLWRQEQKTRAARLGKQLKARWALEGLIEQQLKRFQAHYTQPMVPTRLKDVAYLLMPQWTSPHELACFGWLGDWRPSAIMDMLRSLDHSRAQLSWASSYSSGLEQLISQLIRDIRIEEVVIDEEMAEIQASCILHLPFSPVHKRTGRAALAAVQAELKKIERVISKAQNLRSYF